MPAPLALPAPVDEEKDQQKNGAYLFPQDILEEITDQEKRLAKYTAERCPEDKRRAILYLLKTGEGSNRDIARLLSVHHETVRNIADAHADDIDKARKDFPKKLRRIMWTQANRLEDHPETFPIAGVPVLIKLLNEQAELLEGRATGRIEEVKRIDIYSDWPSILAQLDGEPTTPAIEKPAEAKVIENQ